MLPQARAGPTARRRRRICERASGATWSDLPHSLRLCLLQHPPGNGVELLEQRGVTRFRRGDERGIERAVGADRAGFVLTREIASQKRNKELMLLVVGGEHSDDILHTDTIVLGTS